MHMCECTYTPTPTHQRWPYLRGLRALSQTVIFHLDARKHARTHATDMCAHACTHTNPSKVAISSRDSDADARPFFSRLNVLRVSCACMSPVRHTCIACVWTAVAQPSLYACNVHTHTPHSKAPEADWDCISQGGHNLHDVLKYGGF